MVNKTLYSKKNPQDYTCDEYTGNYKVGKYYFRIKQDLIKFNRSVLTHEQQDIKLFEPYLVEFVHELYMNHPKINRNKITFKDYVMSSINLDWSDSPYTNFTVFFKDGTEHQFSSNKCIEHTKKRVKAIRIKPIMVKPKQVKKVKRKTTVRPQRGKKYVYVSRIFNDNESFIKIGITNNYRQRHILGKHFYGYDYKVLNVIRLYDGADILERRILNEFVSYKYRPQNYYGGWTECLTENSYDKIKNYITEYNQVNIRQHSDYKVDANSYFIMSKKTKQIIC